MSLAGAAGSRCFLPAQVLTGRAPGRTSRWGDKGPGLVVLDNSGRVRSGPDPDPFLRRKSLDSETPVRSENRAVRDRRGPRMPSISLWARVSGAGRVLIEWPRRPAGPTLPEDEPCS